MIGLFMATGIYFCRWYQMKSKRRYIAFDTETGGINPKVNPILTAYFVIISDDYSKIDELELKIKASDPYSKVEADALEINKINIEKHNSDPDTLDRLLAVEKLREFLKKHKGKARWEEPVPLGHNISFDIKMINQQLIPEDEWNQYVGYAIRDTKPVSDFLKDFGVLPPEVGKLESLVKHLNIPSGIAHTAKDDVIMTIEVYRKLGEMVKNLSLGSGLSIDVLDILEK